MLPCYRKDGVQYEKKRTDTCIHVSWRDSHYQGASIPVKGSNDQKFRSTGETASFVVNVARLVRDIVSRPISLFLP